MDLNLTVRLKRDQCRAGWRSPPAHICLRTQGKTGSSETGGTHILQIMYEKKHFVDFRFQKNVFDPEQKLYITAVMIFSTALFKTDSVYCAGVSAPVFRFAREVMQ